MTYLSLRTSPDIEKGLGWPMTRFGSMEARSHHSRRVNQLNRGRVCVLNMMTISLDSLLEEASEDISPLENSFAFDAASAPVNILLVDDRPAKLMALEAVIAYPGRNVVKAQSGREALRHLLRQDFAAILL